MVGGKFIRCKHSFLSVAQGAAYLVVLLFFNACGAQDRPFTPPPESVDSSRKFTYEHKVDLFRVQNGLTVAIVPDDNTNLVQIDMRYRVGAAEDPAGKEGLAHLVEHIMFGLRKDVSKPTLTDRLRDSALFHNASTTWDETNYTSTGSRKHLADLLKIEGDRINATCDLVSDQLMIREREVVRQEISWRQSDQKTMRSVLREVFFPAGHPYHVSVGGSDASVAAITRDDVCEFIQLHYAPGRAILVVSGAVDPQEVRKLVAPVFGPIGKTATGRRAEISQLKFTGKETHHRLDIEDASVAIAFPYPNWGTSALYHADLFTDILYENLESAEGSKGLESVSVGIIGGVRSRAIVFVLTPEKAGNREAMISLFFEVRKNTLMKERKRTFVTRRSLKRAALVAELEPFSIRANRIADYLQYTDHFWFMLKDMSNLEKLLLADLKTYQKSHFLQHQSHIAYFDPSGEAESKSAQLREPSPEMDISPWKSPIHPEEADHPLAYHTTRVQPYTLRFTLDNGLRVILAPDFEYPTVDMRLIFPVGDAMDPVDKPGLAYWTASLLSNKMEKAWTAKIWNRVVRVREMGGTRSVYTTDQSTVFSYTGLSMFSDGLLWKLHWLLESGTVSKQLKRLHKAVARIEKKQDGDDSGDSSDAHYSKALIGGMFGANHPYAIDRSLLKILGSLKGTELEAFRNNNYGAEGATLIITGKIDALPMKAKIKTLFGSWPSGSTPPQVRQIPAPEKRQSPRRTLVVDPQRMHPQITVAFAAGRGVLADRALRLVVKTMIEQRMSSVREKLGASYGVTVSYDFNQGPGNIVIRGTVNHGKGDAALKLILTNLAELRSGANIRDDFARARRRVLQQALANTANATNLANQLSRQVSFHLPRDYDDRHASAISSLTLEQVESRLAKDLAPNMEVLIIRSKKNVGQAMFKSAGISTYETK